MHETIRIMGEIDALIEAYGGWPRSQAQAAKVTPMTTPSHDLPLVARQDLVDQVLDRLLRPDDVREQPNKFIQPGFYGLAGVGKSRLLGWAERGYERCDPALSARYNAHMQALQARLASM